MSKKKIISIKRIHDEFDCETCGMDWADGAIIKIDDKFEYELTPIAHCYNGQSYSEEEILIDILNKLGYEVKWDYGDE